MAAVEKPIFQDLTVEVLETKPTSSTQLGFSLHDQSVQEECAGVCSHAREPNILGGPQTPVLANANIRLFYT